MQNRTAGAAVTGDLTRTEHGNRVVQTRGKPKVLFRSFCIFESEFSTFEVLNID